VGQAWAEKKKKLKGKKTEGKRKKKKMKKKLQLRGFQWGECRVGNHTREIKKNRPSPKLKEE